MTPLTTNSSYLRLWRSGYNTFVMLKMSSSVGLPTIGVKSLEAVARSNAVAVACVDAIVMGGSWPERSALSWSWSIYSATDKEQ